MDLSLLLSAASLTLCVVFCIFCRAYLRRRTGPERILADYREEVDKLIVEIDGATARDADLVEDRIKTLRGLLDDADRRIAVYVRELDRRRAQEKAYADLGKPAVRAVEPVPSPPPAEEASPIIRRRSLSMDIEVKPLPLSERVAELYHSGVSTQEIAGRLDVTVAEVDLAVALLRRKGGANDRLV